MFYGDLVNDAMSSKIRLNIDAEPIPFKSTSKNLGFLLSMIQKPCLLDIK